jgi:nucleotide-binding universal stress UspA family protein
MKVLIAVDSSELSHHVAEEAKHLFPLAQHFVLSTATASPYLFSEPLAGGGFTVLPTAEELESSEIAAEHAAQDANKVFSGSAEEVIDSGDPGQTICEQARMIAADVVVVGRGHKTWLSRLFAPSVSEFVIANAPCPVVVVREGISGSEGTIGVAGKNE